MLYFLFYNTPILTGKLPMNTNQEAHHINRKGKVITNYTSAFSDPLKIRNGEELLLRRKETVWDGWLWCTTDEGKSGWIPESFVDTTGDLGTANRDYDATELTVMVGDELEILEEASSWVWCRDTTGTLGWVPLDNLEIQKSK
jgi:uncharacterized protein YgiM (DUF1202 family)